MAEWESRFVDVDGIRTHYLEAGSGSTLVLLHAGGFGECAEISWEHNLPALAERFRVVAPDWLGFGLTDKLRDFSDPHGRPIRHMARFLDALGIADADFMGSSMGGTFLVRVAATAEPVFPIRRMVLVSGGGYSPMNDARRTLGSYDGTLEGMREQLRVVFEDPRFAEDDEYVHRKWEMSLEPGAWECFAAAQVVSPAVPPRSDFGVPDTTEYELVDVPTLVVAGAHDKLREPGYAHEVASRIPGAEVIVYDDAGHCPHIERADEFNRAAIAFLTQPREVAEIRSQ